MKSEVKREQRFLQSLRNNLKIFFTHTSKQQSSQQQARYLLQSNKGTQVTNTRHRGKYLTETSTGCAMYGLHTVRSLRERMNIKS